MLKKIVVVLAGLLVVVAFLLMRDYDSPVLGQTLLDEVSDATGIEMTATGFRFNLFSGVELDNVTATSRSEGRSFDFSLDQLVFEHRLGPLLSGTVAIDRIVLDRPQFELVEASSSAGAKAEVEAEDESGSGEDAGGAGFALEVSQILVRNHDIHSDHEASFLTSHIPDSH